MALHSIGYVPYCGAPPVPGELWHSWNLDPLLILALLLVLGAYLRGAAAAGIGARNRYCFHVGWTLTAALLVSPLCNLTVALFSARVGQHMALVLIAAPLIVLGEPRIAIRTALFRTSGGGGAPRNTGALLSAPAAGLLFAALLWLWHAPLPYDATLRGHAVYWLMHLSLFASALLLWHSILAPGSGGRLQGVATCLASSIQMGLLGAILTFAPRPLFESHLATTQAWGLAPLDDQQLGGLIMWVPGSAALLVATLALAASALMSPARP
jgi:putative membrane protein